MDGRWEEEKFRQAVETAGSVWVLVSMDCTQPLKLVRRQDKAVSLRGSTGAFFHGFRANIPSVQVVAGTARAQAAAEGRSGQVCHQSLVP